MRNDHSRLEPFEDGFSRRTVWGALFVAAVMTPGSLYLGLVAGQTLGAAAEWVTLILFTEVARRSLVRLKRQEVFILFYVASALSATALGHLALSGGPFAMTIWSQYLVQSPQTEAIAEEIPDWVVPPADSPAITERNLAHKDWWWSSSKGFISAMTLIILGQFLGRISYFSLGYLLFRLTSDRERLPFPLAPIAAEGATALAESTEKKGTDKEHWRWETFSVGATIGFLFGLLYLFLPVVSGLFFAKPITLFPIPFVDLTSNAESMLPTSLISISFDALLLLTGMILPFPLVVGVFVAVILTSVIGNPILHSYGWFEHWSPGNGLLVNQMILSFDFWMSITCGLAITVAAIGLGTVFRKKNDAALDSRFRGNDSEAPEETRDDQLPDPPSSSFPRKRESRTETLSGRGDFPVWLCIAAYLFATTVFCFLAHHLVPGFPIWIIVLFGFIWTPIHSYISARLIGITGSGLSTPYLKESAFILSGYRAMDIWYAPMQTGDFGSAAQRFRELELTRTRFTSVLKAEALILPVSLITSFLFWWGFWNMNQIPSDSFPFISRTWPIQARQAYLILTANASEHSLLLEALKPELILSGCIGGFLFFAGLWVIGLPTTVFYGMVGGTAMPLHVGLLLIGGALLGRYVFRKKFGEERWTRMVPVVTAGFACGMGLAGMLAVGGAILSFCTKSLPF